MKLFYFFLLLICTHFAEAESDTVALTTVYRVIEASPYDFAYALKNAASVNAANQKKSRLQEYFEVSRKENKDETIEITAQFKSHLLPSELRKYALVHLTIKPLPANGNDPQFRLDFLINGTSHIESVLTVLPHSRGSILKLEVEHTNIPFWLFSRAVDLMIKLNLVNTSSKNNN